MTFSAWGRTNFASFEDWLNFDQKTHGAELRVSSNHFYDFEKKKSLVQPSSFRALFINVLFGLLCSGMWSESETLLHLVAHWNTSKSLKALKDFHWDI